MIDALIHLRENMVSHYNTRYGTLVLLTTLEFYGDLRPKRNCTLQHLVAGWQLGLRPGRLS
jgi:hypothetical protein